MILLMRCIRSASINNMQTQAGEIFIEAKADDIFEDCLYDHISDRITKGKFFVPNQKAKDLFSLLADGVTVVTDLKNRLDLLQESNGCLGAESIEKKRGCVFLDPAGGELPSCPRRRGVGAVREPPLQDSRFRGNEKPAPGEYLVGMEMRRAQT